MDKEIKPIVDALWRVSVSNKPEDYVQNYSASGRTDTGKSTVRVGTVRRRVFDEKIFLLRIERDGKEEPQDFLFFNRAEYNKIAKSFVEEFELKQKKAEAEFAAWREGQRQKWEKEYLGKPAKIEKETEWGTLQIKVILNGGEQELIWAAPDIAGVRLPCGHIAQIKECNEILKDAAVRLYRRMTTASNDSEFYDDSPLFRKEQEVTCPEPHTVTRSADTRDSSTIKLPPSAACVLTVDLPERAKIIITERRARIKGE